MQSSFMALKLALYIESIISGISSHQEKNLCIKLSRSYTPAQTFLAGGHRGLVPGAPQPTSLAAVGAAWISIRAQTGPSKGCCQTRVPASLWMYPEGDGTRGITQFLLLLRRPSPLIICVTVAPRGIGHRRAPLANLALPMAEL